MPSFDKLARLFHRFGGFDLGLMASAYFFYAIVRANASDQGTMAMARAKQIVWLEQKMGLFWEAELQSLTLASEFVTKFFNSVYSYGHFPVIGAVGLWLFVFHRARYVVARNAVLISGAISLLVFHLFPLAPPRLLPAGYGFIDTLRLYSSVNYHSAGDFVNQYAAMPSLHIGWILIVAIAVFTTVRNPVAKAAAVVFPMLMSIAVVVTANHYFLDIVGGVIVGLTGLFLAQQLDRHGERIKRAVLGDREPEPSLV